MKEADPAIYDKIPVEIRAAYVAYIRVTVACQEISLVPDKLTGVSKEKHDAHTALRYLQDNLFEMVEPFLSRDYVGQG
jgi:hypothetical protein